MEHPHRWINQFKFESWKRASSGHIHLKGKVNHFINMRQDCCGISPIFLCLEAHQGEIVSRRSSKLMIPMGLQLTVTAQKYFASTACFGFSTRIIQASQPSSGTCRRTSLRRWQRAAAWTGSAFLCRRHWVHHFRIVHDQEYVCYLKRMIFHKPKHLIVSEYKLRRSLMNGQPLFGQPLYEKHVI